MALHDIADPFVVERAYRLDGDMHDIGKLVDDDLNLGAHAWPDPVVLALDADRGAINLHVRIEPGVFRVGQHAHLADFAFQAPIWKGVGGDVHVLAFLHFLNVGLVNSDLDA